MQITSRHDSFVLDAHHVPATGTRKGGIVVIQEIFGITGHIKAICDRFAEAGYEALAPSLYDRIEPGFQATPTPEGVQRGLQAVMASPWDQVADDVQACVDKLKPGPVYVTGFCYGGAVTWLAACRCDGVTAASAFYGRMINMLLGETPKAPIILHYGEKDSGIPLSEVDKVREAFPAVPIYLYDAGHGFCREGSTDFHAESRDVAMERTLKFFDEHR